MKQYTVSKKYGHEIGLSCTFRQWRAEKSHCSLLHGYALSVELFFQSSTLNDQNWVIDFGDLKEVKQVLCDMFDHKTLIAADDPQLDFFREGHKRGVLDLVVVPAVGCEKFAEAIYHLVNSWLIQRTIMGLNKNKDVRLVKVEVREHGANGVIFEGGI